MTKRLLKPAATLVLLLIVMTCAFAKDSWISIRSKNLLLIGNANELEIKQVAVRLEQSPDVFTRLFPTMIFNSPVPPTELVFKNDSSCRPFKPGPNLAVSFTSPQTTQIQNQQPSDQSKYLREVLRKPQQGETQQQGVLLRIDCDAKGIVFQVKVGEQLLKLRTPSFDDIELTTYDPNVNGQIKCGVRKAVEQVVVCFIPSADKKPTAQGVLKSIEFVPKDFKLKP